MTTVPVSVNHVASAATLTTDRFQTLSTIPPKLEWFANLTIANTQLRGLRAPRITKPPADGANREGH
jgi:hypothetical protein